MRNTGLQPKSITLGIYDARNGNKLGTYSTPAVPSNGELVTLVGAIESGAQIAPTPGMYHYVIRAETEFSGFLQHIVSNQRSGTTVDMTTVCALR